jgi:hypothetical protein
MQLESPPVSLPWRVLPSRRGFATTQRGGTREVDQELNAPSRFSARATPVLAVRLVTERERLTRRAAGLLAAAGVLVGVVDRRHETRSGGRRV